jgi:hypothetical protein
LAEAKSLDANQPNSVNRVVQQSTEARMLLRDVNLAQSLYDNYRVFLQGTTVENLTSTGTVRVIESPYIDTDLQYNMLPLIVLIILILAWLAVEFYLLRPPLGTQLAGYKDQ